MIIARVPFRLPLGGGGTDLPAYYSKHCGQLLTSTINKFMYVMVSLPSMSDKIKLYYKYTEIHDAGNVENIEHDIIRESLKLHNIDFPIEIGSMADFDAGTGMGSSSAFTVGLLAALNAIKKHYVSPAELAEQACYIEMILVNKPIGKQDQYAVSLGGFNKLLIAKNGEVTVIPAAIDKDTVLELENRLLMFYTGITRKADTVLAQQQEKISDTVIEGKMHNIKTIGYHINESLFDNDIDNFGKLLNDHWECKKQLTNNMTNNKINDWYQLAKDNGALGGKIMGAGGGGILLLCCEVGKRNLLKETMVKAKLKYIDFRFESEGVKLITNL